MKRTAKTQLNPWPTLIRYDQQHLAKIALPLGGIGETKIPGGVIATGKTKTVFCEKKQNRSE